MLTLKKYKTMKIGWSMVDRKKTGLENVHINLNPKLRKMLQTSKGEKADDQDYYNIVFLQVNFLNIIFLTLILLSCELFNQGSKPMVTL
jgi:hypothetical protein